MLPDPSGGLRIQNRTYISPESILLAVKLLGVRRYQIPFSFLDSVFCLQRLPTLFVIRFFFLTLPRLGNLIFIFNWLKKYAHSPWTDSAALGPHEQTELEVTLCRRKDEIYNDHIHAYKSLDNIMVLQF